MKDSTARKLRQIPAGYLLAGVDPHKKKHATVAMTQDAAICGRFKFDNTRQGYEDVLERARTQMVRSGCRGVIFAIETASHYLHNLAYFLDERMSVYERLDRVHGLTSQNPQSKFRLISDVWT